MGDNFPLYVAVTVGFLCGSLTMAFLTWLPPESLLIQTNDPYCMGWGTTNGKEFPPPSTDYYNNYCHNMTFPITTDREGHRHEACACYESKANSWLGFGRLFLK
jgi:hypothetical protein